MNQLHPIQLREILVTSLSIKVLDPKVAQDFVGEIDLVLKLGTSDLVEGDEQLAVGIYAKVSPKLPTEGGEPAFVIEVELNGQFTVDLENFKFEDLNDWSKINAPFLLLPYIREQVYGLSVRAGVKGIIFPLVVQPRKLLKANK
uniref:Preprotein translocase subunit SecB n=1 Tax=Polaromonas sp. W10N TaxID=1840301 RepID=A0A2S1FIG8_9BURK|nr:protein-export chaperone SecB [Polaromonas sp. W10N]AWD72311.1 preprotein translocase subunit SecB [Polaromonas sp. W10N]